MFDVWKSVSQLGQPCLLRAIAPSLLDQAGIVRTDILRSIDAVVLAHLDDASRSLSSDALRWRHLSPAERWLNTSAMQKSIRRGDVTQAVSSARAGHALDPEHTLRRLAICAIEDVGVGDLLGVAMALAGTRHPRRAEPDLADRLVSYLAMRLASSPKSRVACDLLSIVDYNSSLADQKRDWASRGERELRLLADDTSLALSEQMLAAWILAGPKRFRGITVSSQSNRSRECLMRVMVDSGMPLILYYLADRTAARLSDPMFASLLLIWRLLRKAPRLDVSRNSQMPVPMIGHFPASAFDAHTRPGRRALARFYRECRPLSECLRGLKPMQRDVAVRHGVFIIEGGRLAQQLTHPFTAAVEEQAHFHELAFSSIDTTVGQRALRAVLQENLSTLNDLRREVALQEPCN